MSNASKNWDVFFSSNRPIFHQKPSTKTTQILRLFRFDKVFLKQEFAYATRILPLTENGLTVNVTLHAFC